MSHLRCTISTPEAPRALGAYSQAVIALPGSAIACISGQVAIDPATGDLVAGGVAAQTTRCLQNVDAICRARGVTLTASAVQVRCFLRSQELRAELNSAYAAFFKGAELPARSTVVAPPPLDGALIEIEAMIVVPWEVAGA
jgi:2-iminobutanoate/2-iminopropanoate deaminase